MRAVPIDGYRMRVYWKHTDVREYHNDGNDQQRDGDETMAARERTHT